MNEQLNEWLTSRAELVANLAGKDPNDGAVWKDAWAEAEADAGELLTRAGLDVLTVNITEN